MRDAILSGALLPGQRLRAQELRDRFGLGLTPLREALTRLSVEGMVAGTPQKGMRVAEATPRELADLTDVRCEIERLCLARAIAEGDAAWEAGIVAAFHLLSRAALPRSPADRAAAGLWEQRHRAFHHALVAACRSDWLLRFRHVLVDHSERYRILRLLHREDPGAGVRDIGGEHAAIMSAVLRRDLEGACALMEAHLRATERAVMAVLAARSA